MTEPYGQARQASWTYILLLVLAAVVITAFWAWSVGHWQASVFRP